MIRKGKLWKQCKKCGKMYKPVGKFQRLCFKCSKRRNFEWLMKTIEDQQENGDGNTS